MEIMEMDHLLRRFDAVLVTLAVGHATLHAAAGQP